MKLSEQVKPMSYFKAHAPEVIRYLAEHQQPVIITLHGEAKAVEDDHRRTRVVRAIAIRRRT